MSLTGPDYDDEPYNSVNIQESQNVAAPQVDFTPTTEPFEEKRQQKLPIFEIQRKFLLKSFIFLLIFNSIISIPTLILFLTDKNFYNVPGICVSAGLVVLFSEIAESKPFWFIKQSSLCSNNTILYGISLMVLSIFTPSVKCSLYFLFILFINNFLFILIGFIPYSKHTRKIMYGSNILSSFILAAVLQEISYFYFDKNDPVEYRYLGWTLFLIILVCFCHTFSSCSKADKIKDETYGYYLTQIYIMNEMVVVALAIFYYTFIFVLYCYYVYCRVICCCLKVAAEAATYQPTYRWVVVEDYGSRYTSDSGCKVF